MCFEVSMDVFDFKDEYCLILPPLKMENFESTREIVNLNSQTQKERMIKTVRHSFV